MWFWVPRLIWADYFAGVPDRTQRWRSDRAATDSGLRPGVKAASPPPVATVATVPTVPPPANGGESAAADALKRAADDQAKKDAEDQRKKDQVSSLMTQALGSSDPQQQKDLYEQVMHLDPANPNAMAGSRKRRASCRKRPMRMPRSLKANRRNAPTKSKQTHRW